ncbi:MAG: hypothetical protein Q4D93_05985 [Porphyromonas sp.]|nr:hypothetical protein [Porphyromonas sp.]
MEEQKKLYTIALDFDGTIVTHKYPEIGEEIPDAVRVVKQLIRDGHRIILWSVREGTLLDEALQWCEERGLTFYAVNQDFPEEQTEDRYFSRKIKADIFIDDRAIGGLPSWSEIYRAISSGDPHKPLHYTPHISDEQRAMMTRYQSKDGGYRRGSGLFKRR